MITTDTGFSLGGVTSQLCMQHDADGATLAVLATIRHRSTGSREPPPMCGNGFDTAEIPFAKGHLVALELGGSDHRFNVVPQFEHWQGKPNGEWRQMEITLRDHIFNGCLMHVAVGYGRDGAVEAHQAAVDAFRSDQIRDWTDPRIPDYFKVRVWDGGAHAGVIDDDAGFQNALTALQRVKPRYKKTFRLGKAMPQPDRGMYVTQFALGAARALHTSNMRDDSLVTYLLEPGVMQQLRQSVAAMAGVTAVEAAGLQAFSIMRDDQAGLTAPKVLKLIKARGKQGLPMAHLDDIGLPNMAAKRGADGADSQAKRVRKSPQ